MKLYLKSLIHTLIFLFIVTSTMPLLANEPNIRVAINSTNSPIHISAINKDKLKIFSDTQLIEEAKNITISNTELGIQINSKKINAQEITIQANSAIFNIEDKTYKNILKIVRLNNKLLIINDLPLETYISGLINSEISSSWPKEAIKAQAIAARTYALIQIQKRKNSSSFFDIKSTVMDQVYAGAHKEDARSRNIVQLTKGQILQQEGKIFPAFYHSCCGGITEHPHNVWNNTINQKSVIDPYCKNTPKFSWSFDIETNELKNILKKNNIKIGEIQSITTIPFFDSQRIDTLIIEHKDGIENIKATKLRSMIGYTKLKSTWFEISLLNNQIKFEGKGYGHGVGMCQWGSKVMAEQGYKYNEILNFYYPETEIVKIY